MTEKTDSKGKYDQSRVKTMYRIRQSGASEVLVSKLKAGNIEFSMSGRSHASSNLEMTDGKFNLSEGSTIDLDGSGVKASIVASGGSQINLV